MRPGKTTAPEQVSNSASATPWPSREAPQNRDISGKGAFQNGAEDARLGLSLWPLSYKERVEFGINGQLMLPTGFRDEQSYYDSTTNQVVTLPAYSLEQSAGQLSFATNWTPSRAAELNAFMGYFGTSDNSEQALRWGLGMSLTPFGKRIGASVAYGQSITRVGHLPDTEVLRGGLDIQLPWGFGLHPAMYAELEDDPLDRRSGRAEFRPLAALGVSHRKAMDAACPKFAAAHCWSRNRFRTCRWPTTTNCGINCAKSLKPSFEVVLPLRVAGSSGSAV